MGPKKRSKRSKKSSKLGTVTEPENGDPAAKIPDSHEEQEAPPSPQKCFKSLPDRFKTVVDELINADSQTTEDSYLEEFSLGSTQLDEQFSLWFADILLAQVLRFRGSLDRHYARVLTSWLEGEMFMLQDELPVQKEFFNVMREIFIRTHERISRGEPLLQWNSMVQRASQQKSVTLEPEETTSKLSSPSTNIKQSVSKKSDAWSTTSTKSQQKSETKGLSANLSEKKKATQDIDHKVPEAGGETSAELSSLNPIDVLDVIINVTYAIYGDDYRYDLLYAILNPAFGSADKNYETNLETLEKVVICPNILI